MGIVRTVLISTIDLRNPKSFCKNLSLQKFKKLKFQYFPLYFWEYSLVKIKVQFWEGRWPWIKKFRKRILLSTKFYRRKHLSQIRIWFTFTFTCGLKVSMHQIKLHNEKQYLGFSGRFPAQFTTMYTANDHPRALVIQDFPQRFEHEEETVFREDASAGTQR